MGTPDFACPTLSKLLDSEHEIVAVYTQAPKQANRGMKIFKSKIHQLAEENNLNIEIPTSLRNPEEQDKFKKYNADIAVVAAYGMLLPPEILVGTKYGCINIHPSDLPRWRGAAPLQRTIMAGDTKTKICIMQMDEGLDTGDIILSEDLNIDEVMNVGQLHDITAEIGARMTIEALSSIEQENVSLEKQNIKGVTYANKINKNDEKIDFNQDVKFIFNQIRGLSPYPGAYFNLEGKKYKIFEATYTEEKHNQSNGKIIGNDFSIACNKGIIHPTVIQKEGKKKTPITDFLRGNKVIIGGLCS